MPTLRSPTLPREAREEVGPGERGADVGGMGETDLRVYRKRN